MHSVDTYSLVYQSRGVGYYSQVILGGRLINDSMPKFMAEMTISALNNVAKVTRELRSFYNENIASQRNATKEDFRNGE